jgi:hypothetical protein
MSDSDLLRRGDVKAAAYGVSERTLFACDETELPFNRRELFDDLAAAIDAVPAAADGSVAEAHRALQSTIEITNQALARYDTDLRGPAAESEG